MRWLLNASLALVVLFGPVSGALAQAPAAAPPASVAPAGPEGSAVTRVHDEGGYPDDILVFADEDVDASHGGAGAEGAGQGPHGTIGSRGDRDGGEPDHSIQFPMPDFVRDLLEALGRLLGVAARPVGYVLFAVGIALVIALVVYLLVMLRLPQADLRGRLRRDGGSASEPMLDPLLEGSDASAEEHAAQGRYREAIHALFVRALREATRAGDVDRRGRTAREVVALVERAHREMPPLVALLSLTELVWFGGRTATEAQYLEARSLAGAVETHARGLGPALPVGAPA
jgi:hypothetical protein